MANKYSNQFSATLERAVVTLSGQVSIGASGAVTAGTLKGGGLSTFVKESTAGQYSITLSDKWARLISIKISPVLASGASGIAAVEILETPASLQTDFVADSTFKIQCYDYAGSAVNPASGTMLLLEIVVRNTSYSPFGI